MLHHVLTVIIDNNEAVIRDFAAPPGAGLLLRPLPFTFQFSSVQFIDSMPQLNDRMTEQICRQRKRTKRHQSALTIALKLGLEKQ